MIKKVVLGAIGLFFGLFVGILVAGDAIATAVLPHGHPTAGLLAVPVIGVLGCLGSVDDSVCFRVNTCGRKWNSGCTLEARMPCGTC